MWVYHLLHRIYCIEFPGLPKGRLMNTIAKEEILRLNCPGFGQQSDLTIGNARSLDTYKAIIVNPTSILHLFDEGSDTLRQIEAAQKEGQMEFALPSDDLLSRLNDEAIVRTEELVKFLEGGGLLIYFLCRPFKLLGSSLNMDNYFWLLTLAPDKPAKTDSSTSADRNMSTAAQGRNIETTPDAEDSEFAHYFTQTGLEWSTVIRTDFLMEGYTALALAGTKKCIAAELFAGDNGGRVVFLPAPYSPDFDKTLLECANLWYNRKLGEDASLDDVKSSLDAVVPKGGSVSTERSERVQAAQVEAAKEELVAREKAVAEKLSKEMAATERDVFAKSRQNMQSAKSEGGSSSTTTGTATVAKGESPTQAKQATGGGSNGPSKSTTTPSPPTPQVQKTESGLVVPKLDKTLDKTLQSKPATTSSGVSEKEKPPAPREEAKSEPQEPAPKAAETKVPEAKAESTPAPKAESAPKRPGSLVAESLLKELEESANREAEKPKSLEPKAIEPKEIEPKSVEAETLKAAEPETPKAPEPDKPKVAEPEKPLDKPKVAEPDQPKAEPEKPKPEPEKPKAEPEKPKPVEPKPEPPKAETPPPKPVEPQPAKQASAPQSKEPVTKFETKTPAPEWCISYPFPGLDDVRVERGSLYEQIRQLQSKINNIDDKIAALDSIKNVLLAGEGEDLISVCKKTFTKLGWSSKPTTTDEELWLCVNGEPEAVVRIVRSPDQAKRGDLAQLDLACTKFWEENGREAKGILLTSTWTKSGGPDEPDFPTPVAEFAEKHNLCLLTTAQLLSAFRELELGKGSGEDLRKKIISTSGPLKGLTL
jgi:hypothetical protein